MLEIRNLVKVYKTKGGAEVRALDDVSVRFEEKGMIFLLGKSGSGKSTLLNLCGGLDAPDSGEIIIKGRSSKDFSQSDFDSYRNTFVGFVFQEYNILNEFTVEDNIALALELQGKNKNKKQVREILKQVDLESFAKRKPNTLSGGQKQRVAIARALVKNPEIIMADEPTGALDSNTGKQVFDTLKKLSQDKLVIVVSHDREFAEIYGDRIIELKDGKIISDVTKTKIAATSAGDNISFIGNDTISVKSGASLTDQDMAKIRAFLSSAKHDVIIASGEKEIADYKKVARIDENGARETFKNTDENAILAKQYSPQESKLIRSKLPARHAMRIGASSMKVKPFRLFFTVLLSFIAFTMFGMFSTLTFYDEKAVMKETYLSAGYEYIYLSKEYQYTNVYYEYGVETNRYGPWTYKTQFTPKDLADMQQKYGEAYGAYNFNTDKWSGGSNYFEIENVAPVNSAYYSINIYSFVEVGDSAPSFELLTGTSLGEKKKNDIVISSHLFDSIKEGGLQNSESVSGAGTMQLNSYEDIVGKTLSIRSRNTGSEIELTVKGVYRLDPPAKYDTIKEGSADRSSKLYSSFQSEIDAGTYGAVLVSPEFYNAHKGALSNGSGDYKELFTYLDSDLRLVNSEFETSGDQMPLQTNFYSVAGFSEDVLSSDYAYFFGERKTTLADNEVIVGFNVIYDALWTLSDQNAQEEYNNVFIQAYQEYHSNNQTVCDEYYNTQYQQYIDSGWDETEAASMAEADLYSYIEDIFRQDGTYDLLVNQADEKRREVTDEFNKYSQILSNNYYDVNGVTMSPSEDDYAAAIKYMEDLGMNSLELPETILLDQNGSGAYSGTFNIVGFWYGPSIQYSNGIFFSETVANTLIEQYSSREDSNENPNGEFYQTEETKYEKPADAIYNYILLPMNESTLGGIVDGEGIVSETDDTLYKLYSPISDNFEMVNSMIKTFETVFLWVGVVMAVFSMLLLFNFISVSITNKKKEIGILRAVGARSADVFKIFYSESAIITIICFALAMVACFVLCPILNRTLADAMTATIFVFGPISWLVMLGIAVVTSVIATFLPVYSIARKKPVESIRAL